PLCFPTASCAYVEVWKIGICTLPVRPSGSCPAWMASVSKPGRPDLDLGMNAVCRSRGSGRLESNGRLEDLRPLHRTERWAARVLLPVAGRRPVDRRRIDGAHRAHRDAALA